jgi:ABC-type transporter Mla maintaining outer membrane lipid asymmetry ATPase subunit MlaF
MVAGLKVMDRLKIIGLQDKLVDTLSGGERKRLGLAVALVQVGVAGLGPDTKKGQRSREGGMELRGCVHAGLGAHRR